MNPGFFLFILGAGFVLGILGYTYHEGKKSCIDFYEAQILANKIVNQDKEIKNYKEAQEYSDQLIGEANLKATELEDRNVKLQAIIDSLPPNTNVCVSDEFLRELENLRGASSKKNNTKSAK